MIRSSVLASGFLVVVLALGTVPVGAIDLPLGFIEEVAVGGVPQPIDFDWDPLGGLWIAGKDGKVWVDRGTPSLALTIPVNQAGDSGLTSIAVDPGYGLNRTIWIYYTAPAPESVMRLSRFRNSGDTLIDEVVVVEMPWQTSAYNGGCLGFFQDQTIYVANGFDGAPSDSQDPFSLRGAMLRVDRDGSAPADNPFFDGTGGDPRVWAYGLRNAYRCSVQPSTGLLFIGDVGAHEFEELNVGTPGGNYGFPDVEGPADPPNPLFVDPFYARPHPGPPNHSAIIAGGFAEAGDFAPAYMGNYFFADHNQTAIYRMWLDGSNNILGVDLFASGAEWPVTLKFGPDGALYYSAWFRSEIRRIVYEGSSSAGGKVDGLQISVFPGLQGMITLSWHLSCNPGDDDYAIYRGTIGDFGVVDPLLCSTNGSVGRSIWPGPGDEFYLIAPHNGFWQGSFGTNGDDEERLPTGSYCMTQEITDCQ